MVEASEWLNRGASFQLRFRAVGGSDATVRANPSSEKKKKRVRDSGMSILRNKIVILLAGYTAFLEYFMFRIYLLITRLLVEHADAHYGFTERLLLKFSMW